MPKINPRIMRHYMNNKRLKCAGVQMTYTKEQVEERIKCSQDPLYFIENYVHIRTLDNAISQFEPWDFQKDYIRAIHENRFVIAKWSRQIGKSLCLTTNILAYDTYNKVPYWTTMEDIKVGDYVYGSDGKPTKVTFCSEIHYKDCYELTFDNGQKITACKEHLWEVNLKTKPRQKDGTRPTLLKKTVLNTEELIPIFEKYKKQRQGLSIDLPKPLEFDKKEYNIDPYVLGAWLGDGYSSGGYFACSNDDKESVCKLIAQSNENIMSESFTKSKNGSRWCIRVQNLTTRLRESNLIGNKHIPEDYMFGDIPDRIALVQGLMDTDGYINKKGNTCQFYQKDKKLIDQFVELLSSLGIKARTTTKTQNLNKIKGCIKEKDPRLKTYYTVTFTSSSFCPFRLERKAKRWTGEQRPEEKRYYIQSIEKVKTVPSKCIQVDNEDHLFLVGRQLIPTHNTTCTVSYMLWQALFQPAQCMGILADKSSTANKILKQLQTSYEYIPLWMQQGIVSWNKGSIELENGTQIIAGSTSGSAARGNSFNFVLLDEFAFVPSNIAQDFMTSVYPTISSGTSSKIIIVSTPKGMNLFYKMWIDAIEKRNNFFPVEALWSMVPGRDEEWKKQEIRNIGEAQFNQEYGTEFLGSQSTLISSTKLNQLAWVTPEYTNNEETIFLYERPQPNHNYVMVVDTALGQGKDYSAFSIIDVTCMPYKQVCVYRNNDLDPLLYPTIIYNTAMKYNEAYLLIEVNPPGDQIARLLHQDFEYENIFGTITKGRGGQQLSSGFKGASKLGVTTSSSVKIKGCNNLKSMIEADQLIIQDYNTIEELSNFVAVKNSFGADIGQNDDIVMGLALFSWLALQPMFKGMSSLDIHKKLIGNSTEDEIMPLSFLPGNVENDYFVDSDGTTWEYVTDFYSTRDDDDDFSGGYGGGGLL